MKTVAIDTSLSRGSVAALDDGRLAVRWLEPAGEHARLLAAAIADAAAELGWRPADVDLVAVVRGPGSFTGLRVGVTTAKAFAWATGCRLLGISGFEAIARVAGATLAGLGGGLPGGQRREAVRADADGVFCGGLRRAEAAVEP
jgi:tRNA threonylcarbamoyl adenosine modification protein YeaZ